jgi:phosphomannomutase
MRPRILCQLHRPVPIIPQNEGASVNVDPAIFKAYDIRGIYPTQLNEPIAYALGRAFVTFLNARTVILGRDMRLSGPSLFAAVSDGIRAQGADVIAIGMVSTDQFYFACSRLGHPGMMVTASHNPKEYNGFKMVKQMPYLLSGDEGIQDLRRLVEEEAFPPASRQGTVQALDLLDEFVSWLLTLIDPAALRPLTVVADAANGTVGPALLKLYRHLPVRLIPLCFEPDGSLPNHGLDPLQPENRRDLEHRVVQEGADVGFAFDGDGDRFFVIDDRGKFVPGDFVTALLARQVLQKYPGAPIVYDVRSSWAVPDTIRAAGGVPIVERVGHAFIKRRMAEVNAAFAGEVSGHYYFREFNFADSGLIPSLFILDLLSRSGQRFSELLAPFEQRYFVSGEINSRVADVQAKLREVEARYCDGQIEHLDGLSVSYPDWHFNLRPSNTEPLLRLNLEARSRELLEAKRDELLALIRS